MLRPSECCRRSFVAGLYSPPASRTYSQGKGFVVKKKNQENKVKPGKPTWDGRVYRYSPQNNALKDSPLALSPKQRIEEASANQELVDQLYKEASGTGTLPRDSIHQLARAKTYLLSSTDRQALEDVLQVESSLVQVKELNASLPTHIPPENDFSELRYLSPAGFATNSTSSQGKKSKGVMPAPSGPVGVVKNFGVPSKMVVEFRMLNKPYTLVRQISLDLFRWMKNATSTNSSIESHPNLKVISGLSSQSGTTELVTLPIRRLRQELREATQIPHPFDLQDTDTKSTKVVSPQQNFASSQTPPISSGATDPFKDVVLGSGSRTQEDLPSALGNANGLRSAAAEAQSRSSMQPEHYMASTGLGKIADLLHKTGAKSSLTEQALSPDTIRTMENEYKDLILQVQRQSEEYAMFRRDLSTTENPEEQEAIRERLLMLKEDGQELSVRTESARNELIAAGLLAPEVSEGEFLAYMDKQESSAIQTESAEDLEVEVETDLTETAAEVESLYRILKSDEVPDYLAMRKDLKRQITTIMEEWDRVFDDAVEGLSSAEPEEEGELLQTIPRDLRAKRAQRALLTRQLREVELSLFDADALPAGLDETTVDLMTEIQEQQTSQGPRLPSEEEAECLKAEDELLRLAVDEHAQLNQGSLGNRAVLTGPPGTGKSHLLLQAVEWAHKSDWIVYYMPRVAELVTGSQPYSYDLRTKTYWQSHTSTWILKKLLGVNERQLKKLRTRQEHTYWRGPVTSSGLASADLGPVALNAGHINQINQGLLTKEHGKLSSKDLDTIPAGTPLIDLINKGIEYKDASPLFLEWVFEEICSQDSIPVLLAFDSFQSIFAHNGKTTYRNPRFSSIRSWELSVPRLILQYASGEKSIKRGAFLGTLSSSDPQWPIGPELRDAFLLGGEYGTRLKGGSSVAFGEGLPTSESTAGVHRTGAGMYETRSQELQTVLKGLTHVPVPESLSAKEAQNIYEIWLGTRSVIGAHHDERFHAHFTASKGNPKDFVWNGILRSLDV